MTEREKFLASPGLREEPFEIEFNGAKLAGIVRIHPAKLYDELMADISYDMLSRQFLAIEDRMPLFTAEELTGLLPDIVLQKLCAVFVKANTGKAPEAVQRALRGESA